jgi:hypothetical protein
MNEREKSKEQLITELKDLKKQYHELKLSYDKDNSVRNIAEENLRKRTSILSSFNQYSIQLAEKNSEEINRFIVTSFKNLFDVRLVLLSKYDENDGDLIIEDSTVTEAENSKIIKYLGLALMKYRTSINDEKLKMILDSKTKMFTSLTEISFGQIPSVIGKAIEKIFDVGWFQGVALIDKGKLYGTLVVGGYKGQEELQTDIVKIFSDLTSNILSR